jgi:hypothetical protein
VLQYSSKNKEEFFEAPAAMQGSTRPSRKVNRGTKRQAPAGFTDGLWSRVKDELAEHWRRPGEPDHESSVSQNGSRVADALSEIVESLQPLSRATGRKIELELYHHHHTECEFEEDLRRAIRALLEAAISGRSGPIRIVSQLHEKEVGGQSICIEVINDAFDVPDTVRRNLSKAVIARAGQTSFISALSGSRVRVSLPLAGTVEETGAAEVELEPESANLALPIVPNDCGETERDAIPVALPVHLSIEMDANASRATYERTEYVARY